MSLKKYATVRTDNMMGTKIGSFLVSLRHPAEIENGNILVIGALEADSREVRETAVPAASTPIGELALIASEEIVKDVKLHDIFEFTNKANSILRGYRLAPNDIFSVSPKALADNTMATPVVGAFACVQSNTKIRLSATEVGTTIGKVIALEVESNGDEWVVIQVR